MSPTDPPTDREKKTAPEDHSVAHTQSPRHILIGDRLYATEWL
jgi:hypothetical protein